MKGFIETGKKFTVTQLLAVLYPACEKCCSPLNSRYRLNSRCSDWMRLLFTGMSSRAHMRSAYCSVVQVSAAVGGGWRCSSSSSSGGHSCIRLSMEGMGRLYCTLAGGLERCSALMLSTQQSTGRGFN